MAAQSKPVNAICRTDRPAGIQHVHETALRRDADRVLASRGLAIRQSQRISIRIDSKDRDLVTACIHNKKPFPIFRKNKPSLISQTAARPESSRVEGTCGSKRTAFVAMEVKDSVAGCFVAGNVHGTRPRLCGDSRCKRYES